MTESQQREMVEVATYPSVELAESVAATLRTDGFRVVVESSSGSGAPGILGGVGGARILCPTGQATECLRAIAASVPSEEELESLALGADPPNDSHPPGDGLISKTRASTARDLPGHASSYVAAGVVAALLVLLRALQSC